MICLPGNPIIFFAKKENRMKCRQWADLGMTCGLHCLRLHRVVPLTLAGREGEGSPSAPPPFGPWLAEITRKCCISLFLCKWVWLSWCISRSHFHYDRFIYSCWKALTRHFFHLQIYVLNIDRQKALRAKAFSRHSLVIVLFYASVIFLYLYQ